MAKPAAKVRPEYRNYIGGEWVAPKSGSYIENRNPADTREPIGRFPPLTLPRKRFKNGARFQRRVAPKFSSKRANYSFNAKRLSRAI